jgi:hypothetical protein
MSLDRIELTSIMKENKAKLKRAMVPENKNKLCFFTAHCIPRFIVRSELEVPTFATRRLHECHHARAPSGGR